MNFPSTFLGRREYRDREVSEVPKRNKGSTFYFRTRTPFKDISHDCFSDIKTVILFFLPAEKAHQSSLHEFRKNIWRNINQFF